MIAPKSFKAQQWLHAENLYIVNWKVIDKMNTFINFCQILYGEYGPQASILCELWLGLWRYFYGFKIV